MNKASCPFFGGGKSTLFKHILFIVLFLLCGYLIYQLGQKQCQTQILTTQQEKSQNVTIQKAQIYARPNESRDSLLELMRRNTL